MSRQTTFPKYDILGVEVDALTIKEALDYIVSWVKDSGRPVAYAVKPYVVFLDSADAQPHLRQTLNEAELCLPDGVALQWAAAYLYNSSGHWWNAFGLLVDIVLRPSRLTKPLPQKFGGITTTLQLLERCQAEHLSVFLIGSPRRQTIAHTAKVLERRLPDLAIAGTFHGQISPSEERTLVAALQTARPDVILVGVGFPRQEELMSRLVTKLDHGFLIGEGGSFDYEELGGSLRRAPEWMQRSGLEWLWRLLLEPWRLGRQLAIPRFVWRVWRHSGQTPQNRL